jgi:ubiquinone/menaquinone biosynthesis C-methylase UbiE
MTAIAQQSDINKANAEFWNELCGTTFAQRLGIVDHSRASLRKFDAAYLDFYPYLLPYVRPDLYRGKRVLEIGLGFGTVGQCLAEAGAHYNGMDISPGPVRMMRHRLAMQQLPGTAVRGSALAMPFGDESFDGLVSIGCFHHTGSVERAIAETWRVLKPGGRAMLMVYNQFSYRQWMRWPRETYQALRGSSDAALNAQRAAYDVNQSGTAAPETAFLSTQQLKSMMSKFSIVNIHKENADSLFRIPRPLLLRNIGKWLGLDLYIEAIK